MGVDTAQTIVIPANATGLILSFEGQPGRIALDGSTASATNGLPVSINTLTRLDLYTNARISVIGQAVGGFACYQYVVNK